MFRHVYLLHAFTYHYSQNSLFQLIIWLNDVASKTFFLRVCVDIMDRYITVSIGIFASWANCFDISSKKIGQVRFITYTVKSYRPLCVNLYPLKTLVAIWITSQLIMGPYLKWTVVVLSISINTNNCIRLHRIDESQIWRNMIVL